MSLEIPIYERSRKYGYVYWTKKMDSEVKSFFNYRRKVDMWFENSYLGEKNIDWKNHRISVGWSRTRKLTRDVDTFQLKFNKKGALQVSCI